MDGKGNIFSIIDGKTTGRQVELVFVQREWLIEVQLHHLDAGISFGNFLARLFQQFSIDIPPQNFRIAFQVIVKREQLFTSSTANVQDADSLLKLQYIQHPFIDIPTTELVMNVNPGLEIIGCFPVVDFHQNLWSFRIWWLKYTRISSADAWEHFTGKHIQNATAPNPGFKKDPVFGIGKDFPDHSGFPAIWVGTE